MRNSSELCEDQIEESAPKLSMDQPLIYRIKAQGPIDERRVGRFAGVTVTIFGVGCTNWMNGISMSGKPVQ